MLRKAKARPRTPEANRFVVINGIGLASIADERPLCGRAHQKTRCAERKKPGASPGFGDYSVIGIKSLFGFATVNDGLHGVAQGDLHIAMLNHDNCD